MDNLCIYFDMNNFKMLKVTIRVHSYCMIPEDPKLSVGGVYLASIRIASRSLEPWNGLE
jgi:hypothetical protein